MAKSIVDGHLVIELTQVQPSSGTRKIKNIDMQFLERNIGSRMVILKSLITLNVALSQDDTFTMSVCDIFGVWVNFNCYYCEIKASWSKNNSPMKW